MTAGQETTGEQTRGRWDPLINELHKLREACGTPSYETLTRKLIEQRLGDGQDEHSARIAKSSVHDAFRFGRSRINEALVVELVRVMDGDPSAVRTWVAACSQTSSSAWSPPPSVTPETQSVPVSAVTIKQQLVLAFACIALNLIGREFVDFFHLPVFLDMTGTAVAAIALGPWRGAAVGGLTNIVGVIGSGWISVPFALVNIVGALIWGYGVRRWGMGRTLPRFFTLNVSVAFACSVVAVPVILAFLGPDLRIGHDAITVAVSESIDGFAAAVTFANIISSLGDKLVSGFVALVAVSSLPLAFRARSQLIFVADK